MAVRSIVKANPLLFSNRRKISDGKFCSIRSCGVFCASSKFANLRVKSFVNWTSSLTSTRKETLEAQHISTSSIKNRVEKDGLDAILKFMRIPIVMVMLSLLRIMMHGRHQSAWTFSGGAMGGSSFSSSSSHSSSDRGSSSSFRSSVRSRPSSSSYHSGIRSYPSSSSYRSGVRSYPVEDEKDVAEDEKDVAEDEKDVGLLVDGESLQKDLNRIAKTTDSSTEDGWRHMLEETINSLLRHEKYWISSSSSSAEMYDNEDAEKHFKKLSTKERMKFSEETLVNLDDMEKERIIKKQVNDQFQNTYMVVTIVMAATKMSYESHIPAIVHPEDVKKALNKLQHISNNSKIQGLHILWTPQKENEVLSLTEFRENYPTLKAFPSVPAQVLGD